MIFLIFTSLQLWGDSGEKLVTGFDPARDIIADNYEAGPHLIYDCNEKHWVCVMESFWDKCRDQRTTDLQDKKVFLSCAPIGTFTNKRSCFQRQLFLTSNNHGVSLCVNDEWKQKEAKF